MTVIPSPVARVCATYALFGALASAAEWPQFRGAARDGKADPSFDGTLLESWPEQGPPVAWCVAGLGDGFSSVAVADGLAVTMGTDRSEEVTIAFDATNGRELWRQAIGEIFEKNSGDGPRSTPTIDRERGVVFAMSGTGILACLDIRSGNPVWSKNVFAETGARPPRHGARESVLVEGDTVIVTPGGPEVTMLALDANTGDEIWRCLVPGRHRASYSSPIAATIGGSRQIVALTDSGIVGVRAEDGVPLWDDTTSTNSENCATPLALDGDRIFYSTAGRAGGVLLRIEPPEALGNEKWTTRTIYQTSELSNHWGEVVEDNGYFYGFDGDDLVCLRVTDGRLRWRSRIKGNGARSLNRHASISLADRHLYLRGYRGRIALVSASPDGPVERGGFIPELAERRGAPPGYSALVIAKNLLFVRDGEHLTAYRLLQ